MFLALSYHKLTKIKLIYKNTIVDRKIWKNDWQNNHIPKTDAPIIYHNLSKHKPANSSWSEDMWIMDFAIDDNFKTSWISNKSVKSPWLEIVFTEPTTFDQITIAEGKTGFNKNRLEFFSNN